MASTKNIKSAIMILMEAKSKGLGWKLWLQIIHDCPSAIVNAWANVDKKVEKCPALLALCVKCGKIGKMDVPCTRCQK